MVTRYETWLQAAKKSNMLNLIFRNLSTIHENREIPIEKLRNN